MKKTGVKMMRAISKIMHCAIPAAVLATAYVVLLVNVSIAKISEPDNIIYGVAKLGSAKVSLKIAEEEIATFNVLQHPELKGYYLLKVPIDAVVPLNNSKVTPGMEASLYIDSSSTAAATVTIGGRGTIHLVHLDSDTDADGLFDREELALGSNPNNSDTDGDGLWDGDDKDPLNVDSDGDGYQDGYEVMAGTSENDKDDMPVIYVDKANTSGFEDGSQARPYDTITEGVDAAQNYYTVKIAAGIYTEHIDLSKEIRLLGASPTTTVVDAEGAPTAINFRTAVGGMSQIERLTITNAGIGINVGMGSPLLRNNILTGLSVSGIHCEGASKAKIINNTIAANTNATGIFSSSHDVELVNNIISHNATGITCSGITTMESAYNDVWSNSIEDYTGCSAGATDMSFEPKFSDLAGGDFRLYIGSSAVDAGDPIERVVTSYIDESRIDVDEVTHLGAGKRIWITNGNVTETDLVQSISGTSIEISGKLLHSYDSSDESYIYTTTSDSILEPVESRSRIDLGSYGNTLEAGTVVKAGDTNADREINLTDLILIMQVLSNGGSQTAYWGDVDEDGMVGIPEALYILKTINE